VEIEKKVQAEAHLDFSKKSRLGEGAASSLQRLGVSKGRQVS